MLWETIKKKVVAYVDALPDTEFNQIRCNAKGGGMTVEQYLDDMDIRLVAGLREHARPAFPPSLRRGDLMADVGPRGWFVTKRRRA